jgi:hypothetical protein
MFQALDADKWLTFCRHSAQLLRFVKIGEVDSDQAIACLRDTAARYFRVDDPGGRALIQAVILVVKRARAA